MSSIERPLAAENIQVSKSPEEAGTAAGQVAARVLREAIERQGSARVVFASAPSQEDMLRALTSAEGIDWSRVRSLHLDEYQNIDPSHPAAFGRWLADRLPEAAQPGLERIATKGPADAEIERYSRLLSAAPIDLVCLGVGVNGHIAFNEPGDTDFETQVQIRRVPLAPASRQQQVDEGLFSSIDDVPSEALSMTVPAILRGRELVCTVLGAAKARAVAATVSEQITPDVPATALRSHGRTTMFLDDAAASKLPSSVRSTAVEPG